MPRWVAMTIRYPILVVVGVAVGLLGAGYVFAPQSGSATVATVPKATAVAAAATPAAPIAKPPSTLVANRAPVPLTTRTHTTYFVPKERDASVQTAAATTGAIPAAFTAGAGTDGGLPPAPSDAKSGDSAQAKAAIELDGYKNVRALEKGPDGIWRGRAMRGRTEIAIRVDATGSVSAD
jgi:hypothetical protein